MDAVHTEHTHTSRRGDTRARIQQVALELFAEQGYEWTSLRDRRPFVSRSPPSGRLSSTEIYLTAGKQRIYRSDDI